MSGSTKFVPRFFPPTHIQRGRRPQNENAVPFKATPRKVVLKDSISTSRDDTKGAYCVNEMILALSCLNAHEYEEQFCTKEITNFQKCADNHFVKLKDKRERRAEGGYKPGQKLDHVGLSAFLKKFPNI